ncbi:MAG TPA: hypothetical protein ENN80_11130, partial [Candidatus Hydrogenedentes bacterium]|nr:hypothetical protein [Candidatus Hydrogenedentota bacterium]
MVHLALAVLGVVAADNALAARVETLAFHVERLRAIPVQVGLEDEKARRLEEVEERVSAGVDSVEAFSKLYHAIDAVRMWLWENAAERPAVAT